MNKLTKTLFTVGAACALAVTSFAAGNLISISVDPTVKILVNGSEFQPKDVNGNDVMTFIYNGTTYAPLRALAEAYGLEVGYDAARNMATVSEPGFGVTDGMKKALEKAKEYLEETSWSRTAVIEFLELLGYTYEEAAYGADNCGADWYAQAVKETQKFGSFWSRERALEWLIDTSKFTEDEANYAVNLLPDSYFSENKYTYDSDYTFDYDYDDNSNDDNDDSVTLGMQNALKSAKQYLDYTAFSYTGLIKQLEYEEYSYDEAVYAVDNCGADWYEQAVKCGQQYLDYTSFSRDSLIRQLEYEGFTNAQAVYAVNELGY